MSGPVAVPGEFSVLPDLMDAAVARIGAREAYVDGARRITFAEWMRARMKGHGGQLERLLAALLQGDAVRLEQQLGVLVTNLSAGTPRSKKMMSRYAVSAGR